jgi:serine/threonine protein kinase
MQRCPNCGEPHDVSLYVSGHRIACRRCALSFDVRRSDPAHGTVTPRAPVAESAEPAPPEAAPPLPPPPPPTSLEATVASRASPKPAGPLAPPGYLLLDLLGRGGMGEVWRARQLSLEREVAVKILSPELAEEPAFIRRFDIEAAALSTLSHPNVVAIIDRGTFKGTFYFVMEYAKGKSLREKLAHGRLSAEAALQITTQLLSALSYAHRQAIVHRDLKPENILFDDQGVAKVADFGLAAMLGRNKGEELTRSAVAMGTASYMAPEQRRDAHKVDRRADLFSVGIMLYEMLVGEVPAGSFAMPSRRVPGLPRAIDGYLSQALEPDPSLRFSDALEMQRALPELRGRGWAGGPMGEVLTRALARLRAGFPPR